jgi:hypothetical protein
MKHHKRFLRLEKLVTKEECIPAIALKFLNGTIHWADRIFPNEADFHKAVEIAFRNEPPAPGPRIVVINFCRKMKNFSLDTLRCEQGSG